MKTDSPSSRSSRVSAGVHSIISLVFFFIIIILLNYIGFKYYYHKDLSLSQFYALSPKTVDVLKKLDSRISVYTFLNEKQGQQTEQINTLLKEYEWVGGKNFNVERIDQAYDYNRAIELQKKLHFDGNDHLIIFDYKGQTRFVKQSDLFETNPMTGQVTGFLGEQKFTSAIISLIEGKSSKVYFTEGHGEHPMQDIQNANGYGLMAPSLKDENLQTANLNLASTGDIPKDADAVVVAGPVIPFSPVEVQALDKYLAGNGKLVVLLDPYHSSGLDDLLKKYGLAFDDDLVLYRSGNVVDATGSPVTIPLALIYQGGFSSSNPITAKFAQANLQMQIIDARSITLLKDEKGQPNPKTQFLLQTDQSAFGWVNKTGTSISNMLQLKDQVFNKATDLAGPLTIAAAYDGGSIVDAQTKASVPATRVIAIGNSKFLENDTADPLGINFFANCLDWMVKKDAVLDISPKKPQEYGVSLSPMQRSTVWWCSMIFVPGIALALGIFTWFSRRK